jgi:cytochrome P450
LVTTEEIGFNPFLHDVIANPHRFYKIMRREAPILWSADFRGHMLSRYEDIRGVLRDPDRYSSERDRSRYPPPRRRGDDGITSRTMLNSDPPDHTRFRRLLDRYFTPRAVSELEPHVHEIADDLLAKARETGRFDVMEDLAVPLPTTVIAELLGVPTGDRADFKRWSDAVTQPLTPTTTEEEEEHRFAELNEFNAYLQAAIDARRSRPTDDLIGRLVAAREEDALSDQELLSFVRLLLVAGNETTTNLIGNATLALLRNRDQLELLKARPDLMDSAIEEFLRYDGSVQFTSRVLKEPASFYGVDLGPGDSVILILASGNRDEAVFERPDELDITRSPNRHLGFGDWIHICLGQYLARLETKAAMTALLRDMPQIEFDTPAEEIRYRPQFNLRGLTHLPVRNS